MTLMTAPCAVCGGSTFAPVYPGTIPEPELAPERYYSSSRAITGYLPIVRCLGCGLLLTNPRDDDTTVQQIYAALADSLYAAEDDQHHQAARAQLALVNRHYLTRGTLLDVGCATGAFICEAQAAGWQATGLEASAWAIDYARARCPQATWVAGLLETVDFPAESFAAITLWNVLEHVAHPAEVLGRVRSWLAPGGHLFLCLPNAASWAARLMRQHWVLLLREHLWYFSPATLTRLLQQAGFDQVETRPNWRGYSLANIAGRLAQYPQLSGLGPKHLADHAILRKLSLTFSIGEMNVTAQRRQSELSYSR